MTRSWTYGNEAADGRVSAPAAACCPVVFTRRARLEAENLILRQRLVVLRRKSPTRVRLWNIDRLLLVLLYRLYPSLLDAIIIVQPETVIRLAPTRFPCLLALEVPPRRRPSTD
jgi:hypothetical protein